MQKNNRQWGRNCLCGASVAGMLLVTVGCTTTTATHRSLCTRAGSPAALTGHRTHFTKAATLREHIMVTQELPESKLNPTGELVIGPPTAINIDKVKLAPVTPKKRLAPLPPVVKVARLTYRVTKGDTLGHIAQAYKVSIGELAGLNRMSRDDVLVAGRVLTIPPGGCAPRNGVVRPKPPATKYYTVRQGDYLGKVALKTKTTVADLKKWNNLHNDKIIAGEQLALGPGGKPSPRTSLKPTKRPIPANGLHKVGAGQSLSTIAYRYGLTVRELRAFNGLTGNHIVPGQELKLRNGAGTFRVEIEPNPGPRLVGPKLKHPTAAEEGTEWNPKDYTFLPHYVDQSGDTIKGVAEMYGSKEAWIRRANPGIKTDKDLRAMKEIKVPVKELNIGNTP